MTDELEWTDPEFQTFDGNVLTLPVVEPVVLTPDLDRRMNQTIGDAPAPAVLESFTAMSYPHGRDVSSYDDPLSSFPYAFGFNKITQGTSFVSPGWQDRKSVILNAGAVHGTYHYLNPGNGAAQAEFFLSVYGKPAGNELPCACDYEEVGVSPTDIVAFSNRYKELTGLYPIWYANKSTWQDLIHYVAVCGGLWVARYGASDPGVSGTTFWQYQGDPDLDVAFAQLATQTVSAKLPPVPVGTPDVYPYGPDGHRPMASKQYVTKDGDTWTWMVDHFFGPNATNDAALKLWHRTHGGDPKYAGYATFGVDAVIILPDSAPGFVY